MSLRLARRLADAVAPLDAVAESVQGAFRAAPRPVRNALDGVWLGNPLHPALTDVPLGAWTTAAVLDLAGSEAADGALAVGVAGGVGAALTGLNDWSHLRGETKRLGTAHALLNSLGLTLTAGSLVARRRGKRDLGKTLSGLGYLGALVAAHLGGELSFGMGVRVNRTAWEDPRDRYLPVLDESQLNGGRLCRADLEGEPVLVAWNEETNEVCAIAATCSHLGAPLDEGERDGNSVICPWHGSRFDLSTGEVEGGPAVYPQPRFEARIRAGKVEVRAAPD